MTARPWRCTEDGSPCVEDTHGAPVALFLQPEDAALAVGAVNAGDVNARVEVTRLRTQLEHQRNRGAMTASERQHYLGEEPRQSIEPEGGSIARAREYLVDSLEDSASISWWIDAARRYGLDADAVLAIAGEVTNCIGTHGRLILPDTAARLRPTQET